VPASGFQAEPERPLTSKEQSGPIMAKTSPAQFIREVRQELSKVTWPTRRELVATTASVLVMSALAALFFFAADQLIAVGVQLILGLGA
jgi:preprotein translocase subunit SecE